MTTYNDARELNYIEPIYLVEIITLGSSPPTLYFSDREVEVGGQVYQKYLIGLASIGQTLIRDSSTGQNSDINLRFINKPYKTYDRLIEIRGTNKMTGAVVTVKEVYLDTAGAVTTAETIFTGQLAEARNIDLISFEHQVNSKEYLMQLNRRL